MVKKRKLIRPRCLRNAFFSGGIYKNKRGSKKTSSKQILLKNNNKKSSIRQAPEKQLITPNYLEIFKSAVATN